MGGWLAAGYHPPPYLQTQLETARRLMTGNQANNLGKAFLALSWARAPLPWSARLTSTAVAPHPCPCPENSLQQKIRGCSHHIPRDPDSADPPPLLCSSPQIELSWPGFPPPHSPGGQTSKSDRREA